MNIESFLTGAIPVLLISAIFIFTLAITKLLRDSALEKVKYAAEEIILERKLANKKVYNFNESAIMHFNDFPKDLGIYGWMYDKPVKHNLLTVDLANGTRQLFEFIECEHQIDPRDMFIGKVKFIKEISKDDKRYQTTNPVKKFIN